MGSAWRWLLGGAVAFGAAFAPAAHAADGEPPDRPCPGLGEVVVRAADPADAVSACEGARRALRFLAEAGLGPPPRVSIQIVPALPGTLRGLAVGCYLRETRGILLLTYKAFEATIEWFRAPVDRELYMAAAAHEVAHAVAGCHSEPARLPVSAHEYVAYVVMFATMDPALRQRVLARFPGPGFTSTLQINDLNHIVDPNQFGADAWRHYLRRPDRAAWLNEVISGRIVQDLPSEGP